MSNTCIIIVIVNNHKEERGWVTYVYSANNRSGTVILSNGLVTAKLGRDVLHVHKEANLLQQGVFIM